MSYADKLITYQGDCSVLLGKHQIFSDYIKEFSESVSGYGLDCGAGPRGVNGKFFKHCILDGCDKDPYVVNSLGDEYLQTFRYTLGQERLPYDDDKLNFIVCSCVIQHLNNQEELEKAVKEFLRVLKPGGLLYIMFKVGTNDTLLTHFNEYYSEERTFRVFSPDYVSELCRNTNMKKCELLLDENYIPYCLYVTQK